MSHEIEAEFVNDWTNEVSQCQYCTSCWEEGGEFFCGESRMKVPPTAHCNFFQSRD